MILVSAIRVTSNYEFEKMKVSLNWLKEYLDLKQSPEEVADALTLSGLEAEGIEKKGDDSILEIGLTPNLGHCMSIVGMARELSAFYQIPLKRKQVELKVEAKRAPQSVEIEASDDCHRYFARLVEGVEVGPSPDWLVTRLENAGLHSVNNVVDIGNLVMLECGQPLHLFDADALGEQPLVIRHAKDEGSMQTLDEVEREIPSGALLVCVGKQPVAFAGVMGEFTTSVSEKTKRVLIEAAHFSPQAVRKTSKLLNLRTDSSQRFERGIDPLAIESAMDFAIMLLVQHAGGRVGEKTQAIAKEFVPCQITMSPQKTNRLLGTDLSIGEMTDLLSRLEIQILEESSEKITVIVPSFRNDLRAEIAKLI